MWVYSLVPYRLESQRKWAGSLKTRHGQPQAKPSEWALRVWYYLHRMAIVVVMCFMKTTVCIELHTHGYESHISMD